MQTDPITVALESKARELCFSPGRICGCNERCKADRDELLKAWGRLASAAVERAAQEARDDR